MTDVTNEAADIISGTYGEGARALTITYRRMVYTWTVTVYLGTLRIEELCGAWDTAHAAWSEARRIAAGAHRGDTVWQIIDAKPSELALAEVKRLIDSINTDLDAAAATRRVESNRLNTDVQAIVGDGQGFNALRQANRRDFTATRVHTKPLTPAELHLIRNHRDGVVTVRPGQSWLMLRAIHRRIGGVPTFKPGTRIIASLRLDAAGLAAVEGQVAA